MAKKENRVLVILEEPETGHAYYTRKNKRNTTERIEMKKYNPVLRKHMSYKEKK